MQRMKKRYSINQYKVVGRKKVDITQAQVCPEHIYYTNQYTTISECSTVDRGKSKFDKHANLKYRYGRINF